MSRMTIWYRAVLALMLILPACMCNRGSADLMNGADSLSAYRWLRHDCETGEEHKLENDLRARGARLIPFFLAAEAGPTADETARVHSISDTVARSIVAYKA